MYFKATLLFSILFSSFLFSQISGTVQDQSNGDPLQGVNVTAEESGTATNESGEFSIDVPPGTELEFSHIGYQRISKSAQNGMSVEMNPAVIKSGEIIVRAGLSDESLQKTTASVTVITADDIRESGADHFQTLIDQIPNLNWAGGTSRPRYFQIRGIGERSHYFGEGPPNFSVGFVMDDMDLSGLGMVGLLYDLNQIEVFKGPQSSVYGPNAMAGLISMRSTDPNEKFEMKYSTRFGTDNHYGGSSVLNFRIMKNMNMRLTSVYNYSDGFRENVSQNITDSNKREEAFSRMKLNYNPSNRLSILATIIYSELENGYDAWAPDNNTDFKTYSNDKGEDSQRTYGYSLRANFEAFENINITSITSFTETNLVHAYDGDWADSTYWHDNHGFDPAVEYWSYEFYDKNERNRANLTQEIRLSLGSLILGGYFKHLIEQDEATGYLFGGVATDATSHYDFQATAGYAQYGLDLASSVKLKANVRYEKNSIIYDGASQGLNDVWEKIFLPPIHFDIDHSMLGYRASLHYLKDEFTSYYGSISQGYKSGGVNQQPYLEDEFRPYDPEFLKNIEIGFKRTTDNYRSELTAFLSDRKDGQVSFSIQAVEGDPNSFLYYTGNAGTGMIRGIEWEHQQEVMPTLRLNTSVGYLDSWVEGSEYVIHQGSGIDFKGRDVAMAPKITGAIGMMFENESGMFASAQMSFKDEYYFSDSHNQKSEPYSLLNLTLGKSFGNTTATIWIRNALDERYATRGFYFGLIPPDYPDQLWKSFGDPRQVGITLDYTF
jgi:outer membrane receptor protein involved in Fe transport